jgi:hypothetical protein
VSLGDRIRVPPAAAEAAPARGPRGRVWLYAIAFVMLLVAGWLQVKGNLTSNLKQVRWAIGLSVGAAVVAIASVLVPGRRLRPNDASEPASSATASGNGSAGPATKSGQEPSHAESKPSHAESEPSDTDAEPAAPANADVGEPDQPPSES